MSKNKISDLFTIRNAVAVITGGGGFFASMMSKALAEVGTKGALLDISRGAVFWLLSPASKFETGVVVRVDDGFSAFCGV